jgi:chemotaxis protein MotA
MPEAPDNKVQSPKAKKAKSSKPDLGTIVGIGLALSGILGGLILEKGSIQDVAQMTAAMIVLGGTFGAVLVTTPFPVFLRALKELRHVLFEPPNAASEMIDTLIRFATQARKHGIVSLESEADKIADPFFRKALNLAVDGTDLNELRKMMEIDIELGEQAQEQKAKVWEAAGGYSPTIGIIGAVMGLIQVMKHLDDIKEVGHGIAVAFVATLYGVGAANILFLPSANKLRARMQGARLMKELMLEGVIGIVEGLNPTLIRLKLEAFNQEPAPSPGKSKAGKQSAQARAAEPQAAHAGD